MHSDPPASTKELVLRALSLRPGATMSELSHLTGMSVGAIDHAVYSLGRQGGLLRRDAEGGPTFWLPDAHEGAGFALHGAALRFYHVLAEAGGASLDDVASALGIGAPEASRIGKVLAKRRLVHQVRMDRRLYFLPAACAMT